MSQTIETESRFMATEVAEEPQALLPLAAATQTFSAGETESNESLFDRFAWLYVFFRENVFRDDTDRMIAALWPSGAPPSGTKLIELGCGPGFYSCGLASRFPRLAVLGVDRAARQLDCATEKAREMGVANCRFESDDVLDLSHADSSFDVLIAARLFTVLPDQERAVSEMYRVLKAGGRCLIAEPRYAVWASLPLLAMRLLARIARVKNGYCEPGKATVFSPSAFKTLFASKPWRKVKTWQDGRYQYALCEKV